MDLDSLNKNQILSINLHSSFSSIKNSYVIKRIKAYVPEHLPLGITLEGGEDQTDPIFIKAIHENSIFKNLLRENDVPICVNNMPIFAIGHESAINTIRSSKPNIKIDVRRNICFSDYFRVYFTINHNEHDNPNSGLTYGTLTHWKYLNEPKNVCGLYVTSVHPNSYLSNLLKPGDIIISVNSITACDDTLEAIDSLFFDFNSSRLEILIYRYKKDLDISDLIYFSNPIFKNPSDELDVYCSVLKVFKFQRKDKKFGMNIVGGYKDFPLFIAGIETSSPASDARLHVGDQIIKVNGLESSLMDQSQFVRIIRGCDEIILVCLTNPQGLQNFYSYIDSSVENSSRRSMSLRCNSNTNGILSNMQDLVEKSSFIVRALFTFNAKEYKQLPTYGLSFNFGDLLMIENGNDPEWWRAHLLDYEGNRLSTKLVGVVPSDLQINYTTSRKKKSVKFNFPPVVNPTSLRHTFSFSSRNSVRRSSKESLLSNLTYEKEKMENNSKEAPYEQVFYELVYKEPCSQIRPLIILGMYSDKLFVQLVEDYESKFAICPLHTSRPCKENQVSKLSQKIYISPHQMISNFNDSKYVEFCNHNGNFYGTHIDDIRKIMKRKHCILNVTHNAIKNLNDNKIYPIVILIKPRSCKWLMENQHRLTENEALEKLKSFEVIEKYFSPSISSIIICDGFEEAYSSVVKLIDIHQRDFVWRPCLIPGESS